MSKFKLIDIDGKSLGEAKGSDKIFSVTPKEHVVNTALTWYLARNRQGTASAKNRSEVSGGGRKPWKQKGTGRARAGDNRSPIWRKGGVVFPPKPRDYGFHLSKKARQLSVKMVLSDKASQEKIRVIESLDVAKPKTKEFAKICDNLKIKKSALFVSGKRDENVIRASRNMPNIKVMQSEHLNVYDLLKYDEVILTKEALSALEDTLK